MKKINIKKINTLLFSLLIVFTIFFPVKIINATPPCNIGYTLDPVLGTCVPEGIGDFFNAENPDATLQGFGSQGGGTYSEEPYVPLAKIPGLPEEFDFTDSCPLGKYMNIMINAFIGIVAVIAMIMIVMGGINYVMSDLVTSKEEAKSGIQNAILGLIMALTCYLILNTINPSLLNICLDNIPKATIALDGIQGDEGAGNFTAISKDKLKELGINCPGSGGRAALPAIAKSFTGKVNYSTSNRGTIGGSIVNLDCSSFVAQVYSCAGLSAPGNTTAGMFNSNNKTSSLNSNALLNDLSVGSLLGWRQGESSKYKTAGHVVMYIGNGQFIEVNSRDGATIRPISSYNGNYYHLIK